MNYKELNQYISDNASTILPRLIPGGRFEGSEYLAADIRGGRGKSCRWNIKKLGVGSDFESGQAWGDWVSWYAEAYAGRQSDALRSLHQSLGLIDSGKPGAPARSVEHPSCVHSTLGEPEAVYAYRGLDGAVIFYVARYRGTDGSKQIRPWTCHGGRWVPKGLSENRPLYNLQALGSGNGKQKHICILEGEKCVDAFRKFNQTKYIPVTWQGGARAWSRTDWSPVFGHSILIWPDADQPGMDCAIDLAKYLSKQCNSIKIIDPTNDFTNGWDCADAVADGMTWESFKDWAKTCVHEFVHEDSDEPNNNHDSVGEQANESVKLITQKPSTLTDIDASHQAIWDMAGIKQNKKGIPTVNENSILNIMHLSEKPFVYYDEFYDKIFTQSGREWSDTDDANLLIFMQGKCGLESAKITQIRHVVNIFAKQNKKNEPQEWLKSLKWDGIKRVESFYPNYMGAHDRPFTRAVGGNFWRSMVARIMMPGCQVDNMVILYGKQGTFKSSALRVIGGKYFAEIHSSMQDKDFETSLIGKMLIEIGELSSFKKADTERLKQAISCPVDYIRLPYGHRHQNYPRTCILAGTTNEPFKTKDPTGARRFWQIETKNIYINAIKDEREQFFAEAFQQVMVDKKEWWFVPSETAEIQLGYYDADVWCEKISEFLIGKDETTIQEIAEVCLNMEIKHANDLHGKRIASTLTFLGWRVFVCKEFGKSVRKWRRYD